MIRHLLKLVWHRKRANALIMAEIFFSFLVVFFVVTVAAALIAGWNRPLGFSWQDVWVITPDNMSGPPEMGAKDDPLRDQLRAIVAELKAFPQVVDAAGSDTPAYGNGTSEGIWNHNGHTIRITRDTVTDGFANVMQLKVVRGRWFQPSDDAAGYRAVVIDTDLAKEFFGADDPIGKKFDETNGVVDRVVGIVEPYRKDGEFTTPHKNQAFFRKTFTIVNGGLPHRIVLRVQAGTPAEFEETLTKRLHAIAPEVPMHVRRMARMREEAIRLRLTPLVVAGIVALFLISMVALGLTGVLWQTVTRRTREIGLRRALGASGAGVRAQVLAEVAIISTLAVIAGVAIVLQLPLLGALSLVPVQVFAFGVVAALAVIYAITIACGLYPSWLASSVPPAEALRYE
jgi:putative ABC transport system permease protein